MFDSSLRWSALSLKSPDMPEETAKRLASFSINSIECVLPKIALSSFEDISSSHSNKIRPLARIFFTVVRGSSPGVAGYLVWKGVNGVTL